MTDTEKDIAAIDIAIKAIERNKAAIEFARFYRKNVRDGSYKAGSARELQTIMASVLTGILKILEGVNDN